MWSLFPRNTSYFDPSRASFMLHYRVADLDALLKTLRAEDVQVDDKREEAENGKFGWIMDPEGNRIELWNRKRNWVIESKTNDNGLVYPELHQ